MRLTLLASLALLALPGCGESAVAKAERRYEWIKEYGDLAELCAAARDVKDAYLDANDQHQYQLWDVTAGADCIEAQMSGAHMPANEGRRAAVEKETNELAGNSESNP